MPLIVSGLLAAALAAPLLYLLIHWLRSYAAHLEQASDLADEFYHAAQRLVRDDSVPDSILKIAEFLAANVGKPWIARSFVLHLMFGAKAVDVESQLHSDIQSLRGAQIGSFSMMVVSAMLSSAIADPLFAPIYINLISSALTKSGRKNDEPSAERAGFAAMDLAAQAGI